MSQRCIPPGEATTVVVGGPAERWEGDARPGHFRGVATVCAKLFGQVRPDRTYFGEKDWQQLQVVKRMVSDLLLPLEIVGVETVREADGLAMSSRNRFLTLSRACGCAGVVCDAAKDSAGIGRWCVCGGDAAGAVGRRWGATGCGWITSRW